MSEHTIETVDRVVEPQRSRAAGKLVAELYSVFKLRIGFAIAFTALAGVAIAPGEMLPAWKIAVLALVILMSSASAGAFNQFAERELDARMPRTRTRPFVTGRFKAGYFWIGVILALLIASVVIAAWTLNAVAAFFAFCGAFVYGVVYTVWLKRRTWLNIVVGGLAGSFAVLAGAAALDPGLAPGPIILAIVLFLWTPPHFWSLAMALREEYAEAEVPMLPVVVGDHKASYAILAHTVALVALSLLPVLYGSGWIYVLAALLGGSLFIWKSIALIIEPGPKAAMVNFRASLIQLTLLLIGTCADRWLVG